MKNLNFWEEEIYSKNQQWNDYPFTELLSQFSRVTDGFLRKGSVLEVGCGLGNNLIALAKLDYSCHGVDISETAINEAKKRSLRKNVKIDFITADIENNTLPFGYFDFIIDRSTITCIPFSSINRIIDNIYQSLNEDSYFLGFDWISKKTDDLRFGTTVDTNTFTNFQGGKYKNNNFVTAFTYNEIKIIFDNFSKVEINTITNVNDLSLNTFESFSIVAKK